MIVEDVVKENTVRIDSRSTQDRLKIGREMNVFRRKDRVWSDGGVDLGQRMMDYAYWKIVLLLGCCVLRN